MKYSELINQIAVDVGVSKRQASDAMLVMRDVILTEVGHGGEIHIPDIGKFSSVQRAERAGRNPSTGEALVIPARRAVKFKASSVLKSAAKG